MSDIGDPAVKYKRGRRKAVSAASDSQENKLQEGWEPKVFPKKEEEAARIKNVMAANILFKHLDDKERDIILNAMFKVNHDAGHVVIKQGDEGDNFYVIDNGVAEIFVEKKGSKELVLVCKDGDSFGELALMYDAPRAATVVAKTDMMLWAMDRLTYKHIMMDTTLKKRNQHKEFLEKGTPFLQPLDPYERVKVADLSEASSAKKGEVIVEEGESSEAFYIVEKGRVACFQKVDGEEGCVAILTPGDFFGERALLLKEPRACTVKALDDVELLVLDESGYQMVLAPLEESMKKRISEYKTYKQLKEEGNVPEFEA